MTSKIIVNNIESDAGVSTVFFNSDIGATDGTLNVDGNLTVDGVITYEDVTNIDSVGIITAQSNVVIADKIIHLNDTNTAIRFPAADTFTVETSGSEALRVDSAGNVAIGVNDPLNARLRVYAGITQTFGDAPLAIFGSGFAAGYYSTIGFGPTNSTYPITPAGIGYVATSQSDGGFGDLVFGTRNVTTNTAPSERLRINSAGNLGIGIDPNFPIYTGTNDRTLILGTGSEDSAIQIHSGTSNYGGLYFGDSTSGNARYSGYVEFKHGTSDDFLRFGTAATERLRITSAGNIGVGGLTTPGALLSIPAGESNTPRLAIESAVDDNDFTITQYEDSNGTYTMLGQNVKLNSGGNTTVLDSGHRTAGMQLDARHHGAITFVTGAANAATERLHLNSDGKLILSMTGRTTPFISGDGGMCIEQSYDGNLRALTIRNKDTGASAATSLGFSLNRSGGDYDFLGGEIKLVKEQTWTTTDTTIDSAMTFSTTANNALTERLRITSDGKVALRTDNSGGVGAYLSIQNRGSATNTRTGIVFGCGNSDAVLDGTDYGEAQIKVYNDSGGYGNMEFNLHTGDNRSYLKIIGNGQGETGASAGAEGMVGGVAFGAAGIAIDRGWYGQPGIHVFNQNVVGDTDQGTFRFHGWNRSYASYPGSSGSDFGVALVADGMSLTSDRRRKTGITTITGALDTVSQMRGVSYTNVNMDLEPQTHMSMNNGKKLGFIAQEVIPLVPELILDSGEQAVELENGYCDRYNMDYGGVTPLLVEAIKELKAQNEALQARIAVLEGS